MASKDKRGYELVDGVLYNESDSIIKRDRFGRATLFIASSILAALIPGMFGGLVMGLIPFQGMFALGFILCAMLGEYGYGAIAHRFFVIVPQAQAFVTLNNLVALFGLRMNPNDTFGPGISLEWPWVSRSKRSNLSLQIITLAFTEQVPGKSTQLLVTGSYQFKVDIEQASKFVGVDESTIRGGAIDLIKSEISQKLSGEDADNVKAKISDFNQELGRKFGVGTADNASPEVCNFENRYGISSVAVTITGIDLPPDVQKTRDAIDEAAQAVRSVATMFGMTPEELEGKLRRKEISLEQYMEMLDRTLAQGKAATMSIQALKFGGLHVLTPIVEQLMRKGKE